MSIWQIVLGIAAVCGIVYFYPRLPGIGQLILAVVMIIVCVAIILRIAGVDIGITG